MTRTPKPICMSDFGTITDPPHWFTQDEVARMQDCPAEFAAAESSVAELSRGRRDTARAVNED
ncbi:hypothetical protein [Prescottella agglutinans]|uniref:Transcriptional regulator n=1 Tax=Prescottella agglutinans TaxID=1644129 RepID=A0ABT6ML02_9NOCA|nr:hypothetical protein [Prescottella agglutinans]MDH6284570.1 hypothetical protein [Prescottella agglutinans]